MGPHLHSMGPVAAGTAVARRGSIEKALEIEALSPVVRKDLEARLEKM